MESAAEVIRFPSSSNCEEQRRRRKGEKKRRRKVNVMGRGEEKSMRRQEGKEGD
jgi:hypothetical protein